MATKVLLVGLDGAERSLVDAWTADGRLPVLADLRARGRWGTVDPQPGLGDDGAWASFSTTLGPAGHGRFYHDRLGPDGVTLVPHVRGGTAGAPFWDALVAAGRRVAVLDVPKSPMGRDDAFVVADWMTHGAEGPTVASRAAADHPVTARLGTASGFDCTMVGPTAEEVAAFEHELVARTVHRTEVLCDLLAGDEWDLFVAVYGATHCVGHSAWRDHDAQHPEHDPSRRARTGDVVEHVYAAADEGLGRLVDAAGRDALVIVFSVLGMGPNHHGTHLVEEVLARALGARAPRGRRLLDRVRRAVPPVLRRNAPRPVAALGRSVRVRGERAKPYRVVPVDLTATALRVAAAGPDGDPAGARRVPPEVRRQLLEVLGALVDPDSGRPLVEAVVFTEDEYPGATALADVFVVWDGSAPITGAHLPGVGTVRRRPPPSRSGNHRPGGWFVVAGPGVVASEEPAHCAIADLGASVAAQLGVALPAGDGRVVAELAPAARR